MSNSVRAAEEALDKLADIERQSKELHRQAEELFVPIKALLLGRRVKRFGRIHEICEARLAMTPGLIRVYGVRVRDGKAGTRGYDLGMLTECEPCPASESPQPASPEQPAANPQPVLRPPG